MGCGERGGGGGWCGRSIMQVGVGLGAKKNRKPAFGAWFWAGYGLGMGQQPLIELHYPPQRSPRGWGPGGELVWWERVVVLTLGPISHPILPPNPSQPNSYYLPQLLFPSQGPICGPGSAQWGARSVLEGDAKTIASSCRLSGV